MDSLTDTRPISRLEIALYGLGSEQEDLRNNRGLAQPADRGRTSLRLSRRHRAQAHLGGRSAQRIVAGGDQLMARAIGRF